MRHADRLTPLAAALSALATLVCCLPFGFAAAAGAAALSLAIERLRPWLLGSSIVLVGVGLRQVYASRGACRRRNRFTVALVWLSAAIVVLAIALPQVLAGVLASWLP